MKAYSPTEKGNLSTTFTKSEPPLSASALPLPVLFSVTCHNDTHKTNTASGPDGIFSVMLHGTACSITLPCQPCSTSPSVNLCIIPDQWKRFNITLIHKSGDKSDASNYRPISFRSLIFTVLERCIHNRVMYFLQRKTLLSDCQYDFRHRSSTQDALLSITRDWYENLSTNHQVAAVFFDIMKALETPPMVCQLSLWKISELF